MLQEEGQTVGFDPEYVCYVHHPWYVNLFAFYLLFMLALAMDRAVRLFWISRKRRIAAEQPESYLKSAAQDPWELLLVKARSLKNLSHLTVLLSVLILSCSMSDHFSAITTQKVAGIWAIAGAAADALTTFSAGIVVAIVLFCIAVLCERVIHRRRSAAGGEGSKVQPRPTNASQ